jgi:hypothetical protein
MDAACCTESELSPSQRQNWRRNRQVIIRFPDRLPQQQYESQKAGLALRGMMSALTPRTDMRIAVATKLRCLCLCKVEMSLGGIAGSVSRRRGDHHIGAAPASAGVFDFDLAASAICRARFFRMPGFWLDRRGPSGTRLKRGWRSCCSLIQARISPRRLFSTMAACHPFQGATSHMSGDGSGLVASCLSVRSNTRMRSCPVSSQRSWIVHYLMRSSKSLPINGPPGPRPSTVAIQKGRIPYATATCDRPGRATPLHKPMSYS